MDKLLIKELKLKNSSINNNVECSICYDNFINVKNIYLLEKCNHIFCKTCIFKQMNIDKHKLNIMCPLCRTENKNIKFNDSNNIERPDGIVMFPINFNFVVYELTTNDSPENYYDINVGDTSELVSTPQNQNTSHYSEIHYGELLSEQDITTVMYQTNCTQETAINVINNNYGNIFGAIMELLNDDIHKLLPAQQLLLAQQNQNTLIYSEILNGELLPILWSGQVITSEQAITIAMYQSNCTLEAAINALNNNDGDVVEAIMDLTE